MRSGRKYEAKRKTRIKKYLEFFIPTVLTAMATNLASIVDAGIVGNLMDSTALSVINILLPVVQIYAALGVLFGINGVWMALPTAQYIALALLLIAALALKKHKHADSIYLLDRSRDTEVTAFSVGADGYSPDEVRAEVASKADGDTAVCGVLAVIADAATSPRRSKNTDVRICRGNGYSILIKNSGARLSEESFLPLMEKYPKLIYSETIGFSQINVTI